MKILIYLLVSYIGTIEAKFYSKHSVKVKDTKCWINYLESGCSSVVECVSRCRLKGKRSLSVDERCYCLPGNDKDFDEDCKIEEAVDGENDVGGYLYQSSISRPWQQMTTNPICYGTRDESFAKFNISKDGSIAGFRMEHVSGSVGCISGDKSYWGCATHYTKDVIMTVITDVERKYIVPNEYNTAVIDSLRYPPYHAMSKDLVMYTGKPYKVTKHQELRVWYGDDVLDYFEWDNTSDEHCINVFVMYY
ncbi:uncharacterized protein [Clytia hemisphaerica]|uniref:Cnidarian restricted protein n=1 Tax=Clytia hemisphaerica TaxID=252671 RepID=A0A7M5X8Y1_9CNID|eukprot:TCONS_00028201-protein